MQQVGVRKEFGAAERGNVGVYHFVGPDSEDGSGPTSQRFDVRYGNHTIGSYMTEAEAETVAALLVSTPADEAEAAPAAAGASILQSVADALSAAKAAISSARDAAVAEIEATPLPALDAVAPDPVAEPEPAPEPVFEPEPELAPVPEPVERDSNGNEFPPEAVPA